MSKGQSATEYLLVVGFALAILIPLTFMFSQYLLETKDQVSSVQAERLTKQIADNAEQVYYLGPPSKTTVKAYMPKNIDRISIGDREIVFVMDTESGLSEIVQTTDFNVTGTLPTSQGTKYILIESKGNYVSINAT